MVELSISEISKHPKILDELKEIAKIVNKKSNTLKGIFIPLEDLKGVEELVREIEYRKWLERNKGLLELERPDFLDICAEDIGEWLDELENKTR